jgi:hypothetical protein
MSGGKGSGSGSGSGAASRAAFPTTTTTAQTSTSTNSGNTTNANANANNATANTSANVNTASSEAKESYDINAFLPNSCAQELAVWAPLFDIASSQYAATSDKICKDLATISSVAAISHGCDWLVGQLSRY